MPEAKLDTIMSRRLPNASDAYHTGGVWIGLPTAKKHQRRIESEVLGKGKVWVAMCHP
jgi:hypothetical protein